MDGKGIIQCYYVYVYVYTVIYIYKYHIWYMAWLPHSEYLLFTVFHIGYIQTTNDTVLVTSEVFFFRSRCHRRPRRISHQKERWVTSSNHPLTPPENRPYQHLNIFQLPTIHFLTANFAVSFQGGYMIPNLKMESTKSQYQTFSEWCWNHPSIPG